MSQRSSDNVISLRDIKGPVDFPVNLNLFLLVGLVAAVLVLALWIFRRGKKAKPAPALPLKSAYDTAWEQLEALKAKDLIAQGKIKEYHIEISDIIRHYLENNFKLNAPEMTTEEFLNSLREGARLETGHKDLLREFLGYCDLVKFAKYTPESREIDLVWESACNFIRQTKDGTA